MGWLSNVMKLIGTVAAILRMISTAFGNREDREAAKKMRDALNGKADPKDE